MVSFLLVIIDGAGLDDGFYPLLSACADGQVAVDFAWYKFMYTHVDETGCEHLQAWTVEAYSVFLNFLVFGIEKQS